MASGSFYKEFTDKSSKYKLIVEWSSVATISSNSSVVTCVIKLYCPYSLSIGARTDNIITINGKDYKYNTSAINASGGNTYTLATVKSDAITHNTDGSKSIDITCNFKLNATISGVAYKTITASKSVTLDKIEQKATITSAPNFNDEENPVIKYSNPYGNSATSLRACISLTGATDDIAYRAISKTGTSYTFNLTDAERAVLRNATTDANSRTVRFYIETVIGANTYRHYLSKTLSIINALPTLNPSAKDTGSVSSKITGNGDIIIKGYNVISYSIGAAAKKGASIVSQKITCGSKSATAATGTISYVDSNIFTFTATDSRGNTTTQTLTKTLVNYFKPTCNIEVTTPTASNGSVDVRFFGTFFNGNIGATKNVLKYQYRIMGEGLTGTWSTAQAVSSGISGNTYDFTSTFSGLDYRNTYTFQARVLDVIYNGDTESGIESAERKVKTTPLFDWGADDFKFNVDVSIKNNVLGEQRVIEDDINEWAQASQEYTFTGNDRLPLQMTGYILVWAHYQNGSSFNYCTNYTYIPKCAVGFHNGIVLLPLVHDTGAFGFKVLKVTDDGTKTVISGNDANKNTVNSGWVLNRIIAY